MSLYNKYSKEELKKRLAAEDFERKTISFYRYTYLKEVEELRNDLYKRWAELGVLGRIYLAYEGINAQISVPEPQWENFISDLQSFKAFENMPIKTAVEENKPSFYKLKIKVRKQIVADGLPANKYDVTNVGKHLTAKEFNQAMEDKNTIIVDMRNHYESEVGHFKGAVLPDCDTFKEELPMVSKTLKGKEKNKVLLYCTGGIRCEKTSAYLKDKGFEDVNQLHGGIIEYSKQVNENGLKSNFIGKNFVFDERLGERISEDVISRCHQCGKPCDNHTNCNNDDCHLLFIQCDACAKKQDGCCTAECKEIYQLPIEEQRKLRKGKDKKAVRNIYKKGRVRPKLNEYFKG